MPDAERSAEFAPSINELACRLSDLWGAERCEWKLLFEAPQFGSKGCWYLLLEWTQERGNAHHADWSTFTWEFYGYVDKGEGPEVPLADAIEFCESLLPWRDDA